MDQLKQLLSSLSLGQKIMIVAAALAVGGGLMAFSRWKREGDFRPLYTSMSPEDAGAVIQKIKESGGEYRLSENGASVLVPSAKLAELRLGLAAAGLPKSGRIGFELFDKTNFGATEFVEHINYRRALEGELERSVMALSEVEHARIHLTFPKDSIYTEARQPAKASVMVRLRPGARLTPPNVMAVSHLVASAVEGLGPEAVSIVDMNGNLLSRPRKAQADGEPTEELLEFRQKLERDLVAKIQATLEPVLGADKYRAGASVDCDFSSSEQSEEAVDPARSVIVTSQKSEDSGPGVTSSGVPGTASNLPRPTSRPGSALAGVVRRTENVTFQSSRITRHTRLPRGSVKRISLSVLVDQAVRWEGAGAQKQRVLVPPSPELLKSIRELVAASTGLMPDRGDQLIVESLPFEATVNQEPPSPPAVPVTARPGSPVQDLLHNKWLLIGAGVGVVVLLLLVFGALRLLTRTRKQPIVAVSAPPVLPEDKAEQLPQAAPRELEAPNTMRGDVLIQRIREAVTKDARVPVGIIRDWLSQAEGHD